MNHVGLYVIWINGPDGMGFLRKESSIMTFAGEEEEQWVLVDSRSEATRWYEHGVDQAVNRLSKQPAFAEDNFLPVEL